MPFELSVSFFLEWFILSTFLQPRLCQIHQLLIAADENRVSILCLCLITADVLHGFQLLALQGSAVNGFDFLCVNLERSAGHL